MFLIATFMYEIHTNDDGIYLYWEPNSKPKPSEICTLLLSQWQEGHQECNTQNTFSYRCRRKKIKSAAAIGSSTPSDGSQAKPIRYDIMFIYFTEMYIQSRSCEIPPDAENKISFHGLCQKGSNTCFSDTEERMYF